SIEKRVQFHYNSRNSEELKPCVGLIVEEIKEEEILDYNMKEPKEEPSDIPPSILHNPPFGLSVTDDEIMMEDILNDDMIEPKIEPIDAPLNDDQNNDIGGRVSMVDEMAEIGGWEEMT
ncbi:hypothetical protein PMAYCL1PPCAC_01493, partial [Pristionchus mayeri]